MKILFSSHAPWRQTGYGLQVLPTVRMLEALGHQVVLMAVESRGPGIMHYEGLPVALMDADPYGQDIVRDLVRYFQADVVLSLFDPWVLGPAGYGLEASGAPWMAWTPVDQEPLAGSLGQVLEQAERIVAISRYGLEALKRAGLPAERLRYVPHTVDLELFSPPSEIERNTARAIFHLSEETMAIGLMGSNLAGDRKALAEQVEGLALFAELAGRSAVRLVSIAEPYGAVNLPRLVETLGCDESYLGLGQFSRRYELSNHAALRYFYWACDVLLQASAAEGFGIPIVEAMACGLPVIVNRTTSMPEVAGEHGLFVEEQQRTLSPQGGWWNRPRPCGVKRTLLQWAGKREAGELATPQELHESARRYAAEAVQPLWAQALEGLEES